MMKEFKGTPGPWTGKGVFRGVVLSAEGLSLSCGVASEEAKANGRLALAAPELLKELQFIIECLDKGVPLDEENCGYEFDNARKVIAKALGE